MEERLRHRGTGNAGLAWGDGREPRIRLRRNSERRVFRSHRRSRPLGQGGRAFVLLREGRRRRHRPTLRSDRRVRTRIFGFVGSYLLANACNSFRNVVLQGEWQSPPFRNWCLSRWLRRKSQRRLLDRFATGSRVERLSCKRVGS